MLSLPSERKDVEIKEAIETEARREQEQLESVTMETSEQYPPPRIELTESAPPNGEAFDYEDTAEAVDDTDDTRDETDATKHEEEVEDKADTEKADNEKPENDNVEMGEDRDEGEKDEGEKEVVEEEELEISESVTEIEEIFQVSEDGVTWKTVKKITTITPRGTTERVVVMGGILPAHVLLSSPCVILYWLLAYRWALFFQTALYTFFDKRNCLTMDLDSFFKQILCIKDIDYFYLRG